MPSELPLSVLCETRTPVPAAVTPLLLLPAEVLSATSAFEPTPMPSSELPFVVLFLTTEPVSASIPEPPLLPLAVFPVMTELEPVVIAPMETHRALLLVVLALMVQSLVQNIAPHTAPEPLRPDILRARPTEPSPSATPS